MSVCMCVRVGVYTCVCVCVCVQCLGHPWLRATESVAVRELGTAITLSRRGRLKATANTTEAAPHTDVVSPYHSIQTSPAEEESDDDAIIFRGKSPATAISDCWAEVFDKVTDTTVRVGYLDKQVRLYPLCYLGGS